MPAKTELTALLLSLFSKEMGLSDSDIDPAAPISDYGLSSISALGITGELEKTLGKVLPPTLLWDCQTLDEVATFLADPDTFDALPSRHTAKANLF